MQADFSYQYFISRISSKHAELEATHPWVLLFIPCILIHVYKSGYSMIHGGKGCNYLCDLLNEEFHSENRVGMLRSLINANYSRY